MKEVVIYTSSTCPHCVSAKEYLKSKGINYTEKNVSKDSSAKKELVSKGFRGVPVIMVDGKSVVGFDKVKLDKLLK